MKELEIGATTTSVLGLNNAARHPGVTRRCSGHRIVCVGMPEALMALVNEITDRARVGVQLGIVSKAERTCLRADLKVLRRDGWIASK